MNSLEIISIIAAESNFKKNSINKDTGDDGLGHVNWEHWEKDFGKYHRGNGIQSKAYLVNVRSMLSTLNAFVEGNKENIS